MSQPPVPPHGLAPLDPRPGAHPNGAEPEVRLLDLSAVLLREWKLIAAVAQLASQREQLRRLTAGGGAGSVFLGTSELPDLKLGYTRLFREYTKDEQIYIALTASLASAQVDTNDDVAVVSVLDAAQVPDLPSGPRRKLMLMVGVLFGTLAGAVLAFAREFVRRARRDPGSEPFFDAWNGFTGDLRRVVPGARRTRTPAN